jgi:hypothetical protein
MLLIVSMNFILTVFSNGFKTKISALFVEELTSICKEYNSNKIYKKKEDKPLGPTVLDLLETLLRVKKIVY